MTPDNQRSVLHVTFSPSGGAGSVASRLSTAQNNAGWDAQLASFAPGSLWQSPFRHPPTTIAAAADEWILREPSFASPISLRRDALRSSFGVADGYELYHLHWINGLIDLSRAGPWREHPVVWTMHDMNPFTGACHQSMECEQFQTGCGSCPAVRSPFRSSVRESLERKRRSIAQVPRIHMVAPSEWLLERARQSAILEGIPMSYIPNPIAPAFFESLRQDLGSRREDDSLRILVVAAQLDARLKGVRTAVTAVTEARARNCDVSLTLLGSGGNEFRGVEGVQVVGPRSPQELIELLDQSDALVVPSLADTAPSVIYEAAARGVLPIVRNVAGLPEAVRHLGDGLVFSGGDDLVDILIRDVRTLRRSQRRSDQLAKRASQIAAPATVARQYLKLYEELLVIHDN